MSEYDYLPAAKEALNKIEQAFAALFRCFNGNEGKKQSIAANGNNQKSTEEVPKKLPKVDTMVGTSNDQTPRVLQETRVVNNASNTYPDQNTKKHYPLSTGFKV